MCQLVEEYAAKREKIAEEKRAIKIYYQEMHLPVEQIAEKTGLSIEEVKTYISEI